MDILGAVLWVRERKWIGYAVALIAPPIGLLIHMLVGGMIERYPFVTFFPALLLATIAGGPWPGTLATLFTALLADYVIAVPHGFRVPWPVGWIGFAVYFFVAAIMIVFIDSAVTSTTRLIKATRMMRELNGKLEERVADRTRELTMLAAQLRDEIQRKENAETQLRQAHKMQALGQLTSGIAHDFNNLLSIIIGNLDIAQRRLNSGRDDIASLVDNAVQGARQATSLTLQLLAFSRRQALTPAVTDVNALVSNLSSMLRRSLGEEVQLECVLGGGLGRTSVDPAQLENAILNLTVNARDAMPKGGKLTIETQNAYLDDADAETDSEIVPGQYVCIAIGDTGVGMPPEVLAAAFDPFFTTKGEGRGTGLGLSQVYGFIKQSGGLTRIQSEVGQGTTVRLYLPRSDDSVQSIDAAGPREEGPPPKGSPSEVVLVVDDDEAVREIHFGMLKELSYTVLQAASGPEALALIRRERIDLLFTDVVMPGMSGRILAEQALALKPELKVLFTTGYAPNGVVHNGVLDTGVDLLPKPFRFEQLALRVRAVLDRD
jgi:signal transduction histidine kinase